MDFVDWRKKPDELKKLSESTNRPPRRRFTDYVEEQIAAAQERGEFSNLPGMGKPLHIEDDRAAGDNALAYRMLKNNHLTPPEIELAKEIDSERERIEAKLNRLIQQGKTLRKRRVPPFASEKRAFNIAVANAANEYEQKLREINSKILTLNISAPSLMHRPVLNIEQLVEQFRRTCPPFVL